MLAGEESGDQHGAQVATALQKLLPGCRLMGTGGPRMAKAGVELFAGLEELAVMGFVEILGRLRFFRALERRVRRLIDSGTLDLVLPIDYPGFNLRATRHARGAGVPVLYYIAPQVWAWRKGRAKHLARDADHIAVILPFELDVFREEGGTATFVGHPLLDEQEDAREAAHVMAAAGLDPERPMLALFPGSRPQEVRRHLEIMVAAGERVRAARPEVQIAVARAQSVPDMDAGPSCTVVDNGRALLTHADAALIKSGTSTLEAALAGVPFVCVYRTHPVTFAIARRLVRTDHIALTNLVAGERVVPEILQREATPQRLAAEVLPLLESGSEVRVRMVEQLGRVHELLGRPGAARRVAEIAVELIGARRTASDDPAGPPASKRSA